MYQAKVPPALLQQAFGKQNCKQCQTLKLYKDTWKPLDEFEIKNSVNSGLTLDSTHCTLYVCTMCGWLYMYVIQ